MPDWTDENSSTYKIHDNRIKIPKEDAAAQDQRIGLQKKAFGKYMEVDPKTGEPIPHMLGGRPVYMMEVNGTPTFVKLPSPDDPYQVETSPANVPLDEKNFHKQEIFPGSSQYTKKIAELNTTINPATRTYEKHGDNPSSIDEAYTNLHNGINSQLPENQAKAQALAQHWNDQKVRDQLALSIEDRLKILGLGKFRAENDLMAQGKYLGGLKPNDDDRAFYGIVNDMIRLNMMGGYTGQGAKGTTAIDEAGNAIKGITVGGGAGELMKGGHFSLSLDPTAVGDALKTLNINATLTADNMERNRKLDLQNEAIYQGNATRDQNVQLPPDVQAEMRQRLSEQLDKQGVPSGTNVLGKDANGNDIVPGFLDKMDEAQRQAEAQKIIAKETRLAPSEVETTTPIGGNKAVDDAITQAVARGQMTAAEAAQMRARIAAANNQPPANQPSTATTAMVTPTPAPTPAPTPEKGGEKPKPKATVTPAPTASPTPESPSSNVAIATPAKRTPGAQTPTGQVTGAPTSDWNVRNAPSLATPPASQTPAQKESLRKAVENLKSGTTAPEGVGASSTPPGYGVPGTPGAYYPPPGNDANIGASAMPPGPQMPGAYTAPPPPIQLQPRKAPMRKLTPEEQKQIAQSLSVTQNQLPSDAAMGAPLGAPDNNGQMQIPRLLRQEHVDALQPGTPFYWADHPNAYVKV